MCVINPLDVKPNVFIEHIYFAHSPRPVYSPGVTAMVIDDSSPSSSVIRHLSFQSHHFHIIFCSQHPSALSSVLLFFPFPSGLIYIMCQQACSRGRHVTYRTSFNHICVTLLDIIASSVGSGMYSFLILYFRVTPHIHLNLLISYTPSSLLPWL